MTKFINFIRNEEGVTILEYALIVGIISIAAILLFPDIGDAVTGFFQDIVDALA